MPPRLTPLHRLLRRSTIAPNSSPLAPPLLNPTSTSSAIQLQRRTFLNFGKYRSLEEAKSRHSTGPFSWTAGILFLLSGGGLITYFRYEKERLERAAVAERNKGVGKPRVGGGGFVLTDMEGRRVGDGELRGVEGGVGGAEGAGGSGEAEEEALLHKKGAKGGKKWLLVYFGFTHCPDICPEELDKMASMVDLVEKSCGEDIMTPIFITCDPARDTPPVLKSYLSEFHPKIKGITGSYDEIKQVCKSYRVYFSTPPNIPEGKDYLVDHSIYFYLMDPDGEFVEALGRQHSPEAAAKVISAHIGDRR
ncbi:cytochrome c oxidase-like protein [Peziza echinospora]|nr:cytochrome c oxidase-like protein [Peziza echinospora]